MQNEIRNIVDALPGLVWSALPDGQIDFLNRRWCEYTGLSLEETCGWGWQVAVHPDDLNVLAATWQRIMSAEEPGDAIIESHHGRLWATPNDGPGTTFSFSLPHASGAVTAASGVGAIPTAALTDAERTMEGS